MSRQPIRPPIRQHWRALLGLLALMARLRRIPAATAT